MSQDPSHAGPTGTDANAASTGPVGLVAGSGDLPHLVAEGIRSAGREVAVIALDGTQCTLADVRASIPIGRVGKLFDALGGAGCTDVVICGRVPRPDLSRLQLDLVGMRLLPRFAKALKGGDDGLMRTIVATFEENGFRVIAPETFVQALHAAAGPLSRIRPDDRARADIAVARDLLGALSPFDVGQGAVVVAGRVLAVEGPEGTDAMLARVAALPARERGTPADKRGVLVKLPKRGQERRIDLPAIGLETLRAAVAAGLAGIAYEAGGLHIFDRGVLRSEADARGLFLFGLDPLGNGDD